MALIAALSAGHFLVYATEPTGNTEARSPVQAAAITTEDDFHLTEGDGGLYQAGELPPFGVNAQHYRPVQSKLSLLQIKLFFDMRMDFGWPSMGGPTVFTPAHVPQKRKNVAYTTKVFERAELLNAASATVDGALLLLPELGFDNHGGSFSRDSKTGMVLRGVDASYGSVLMLRDGTPLNDPFSGKVSLAALPREGLYRAEVVSGGGATAWGNGATAGVVQFLTLPAKGQLVLEQGQPMDGGPPDPNLKKQVIRPVAQLAAVLGESGTRGVDWVVSQPTPYGVAQLLGRIFSSDGSRLVAPEKAGTIDTAGWSHQRLVEGRWRQPLGPKIELTATLRSYEESHGNGTPAQHSSSRATFASVAVSGNRTAGLAWSALIYAQTGSAGSDFSAVNSARTTETPLIHEVTTPSDTFGASLTGVWRRSSESRLIAGLDFRNLRGQTKAEFGFEGGAFSHERTAGGDQKFTGLFLLNEKTFLNKIHATYGARLDAWNETDGHMRQFNRVSGLVERDAPFAEKRGVELSPSLGVLLQLREDWTWRVNAQRAFRRPTLAENYQTFGRHSVVTEASPGLKTEHNTNIEVGTEYSIARGAVSANRETSREVLPKSVPLLVLGATVFSNEIRNGIASVDVDNAAGAAPLSITLPSGYTLRRRVNFDRGRVQGVQLSANWRPLTTFSLNVGALFNDAKIVYTRAVPDLDGRQMAGVSRSTFTLGTAWHPTKNFTMTAMLRAFSRQFADSKNALRLGRAAVLNLGASYRCTEQTELYFTAENIADARVETDRGANGIVYLGAPRLMLAGVRLKW